MSQTPQTFPIFVGSGRSGTTLVQAIFSAHPDLAITHESQFIPRLAQRPYATPSGFAAESFVRDLHRSADFRRLELDEATLLASLQTQPPDDYADAVRRVFSQYAADRGKSRYGDKSPGYVLHMDVLASLFPEAKFVHVVRDGRAVALSYIETKFGPRDVAEGALYWKRRVSVGRANGRSLGASRYRELRYEDLVADPERVVKDMCPFLDLEFDPAMLRYFEQGEQVRSETADPSAHRSLALPPTKGLRDWRTQMSAEDAALFDVLAGKTLVSFGYERASDRFQPLAAAKGAGSWVKWQGQRATTRGRSVLKRLRGGKRLVSR